VVSDIGNTNNIEKNCGVCDSSAKNIELNVHKQVLIECPSCLIVSKVQVIQKSSKFFFLDFFTRFDRARRALSNCIFKKNFKSFFGGKNLKKHVFSYV
jgi:hypothetical protein